MLILCTAAKISHDCCRFNRFAVTSPDSHTSPKQADNNYVNYQILDFELFLDYKAHDSPYWEFHFTDRYFTDSYVWHIFGLQPKP